MDCFSPLLYTDDWGDDWGWSIDDNQGAALSDAAQPNVESVDDGIHKWLQGSILSLSPNNDIIAVANEDRICVLTRKFFKFKFGYFELNLLQV